MSSEAVRDLAGSARADAICVHLNPRWRSCRPRVIVISAASVDAIARLTEELDIPVIGRDRLRALRERRSTARGARRPPCRRVGSRRNILVAVRGGAAPGCPALTRRPDTAVGDPHCGQRGPRRASRFPYVFATGGMATGLDAAKGRGARRVGRPAWHARLSRRSNARPRRSGRFLRPGRCGAGNGDAPHRQSNPAELHRVPRLVIGELAEWIRQVSE